MNETCEICGWNGDAEELNSHQEADHEVWIVFTCPDCSSEIGRKRDMEVRREMMM